MSWVRNRHDMISEYDILIGRTKNKRKIEEPRCRENDNTEIDLKDVSCEDVDWIQLAVYSEYSNEPSGSIKVGEFLDYTCECQATLYRTLLHGLSSHLHHHRRHYRHLSSSIVQPIYVYKSLY